MLRITRYKTWEELQELQPYWNSLLSSSSSDTVFLTWEWCEAWWKSYGLDRELFVLAAWKNTKLLAIAPFYVDSVRRYGCGWRNLRFIGDGTHDSDYLDCFALSGHEAETMSAIVDFLRDEWRSWDWLELNGPRKNSACSSVLVGAALERGWKFSQEQIPCATLKLPASWDEYLRMLEPRIRTKVRSSLNLVDSTIKSVPEGCSSEDQIEEWLSSLFDLHTRRWTSENKPGVFRTSVKQSFYWGLSRVALKKGWLAFHRLNWGERTLALQYGLLYQNRFHLLQEGYDPDFSSIRPGLALRAWLIRQWIDSRLEEYDFLGGVARHKLDWGAQETFCTRLLIAAKPAASTVALALPQWRSRVRESVARTTPHAVLTLRKKILSSRNKNISKVDSQLRSATGISHAARQAAAKIYSSAPLQFAGRTIASKYRWNYFNHGWSIPIHRRDRPVVHIFQYHRVNDEGDPFFGGLPTKIFRAQMRHIASSFPIVTLDQISNSNFSFQHKYCAAITFDDGYRDNFGCAFPILKEFGIPATIFLATGYIDNQQLPWYDQIRLAFKLTTRARFSTRSSGGPGGSLAVLSSRLHLMEQTLGWLRGLPEAERALALSEIFCALGVASDLNLPNQLLRWEDIRQMNREKISFGAHTIHHPVLSKVSPGHLKREIEGSKRAIENRLQQAVSHFAYPFGQAADFNVEAKQAVCAAGFKTAVTTIWGLNEPGEDLFELKRFTPWETNLAEFKMKLDWFRFRQPRKQSNHSGERAKLPPVAQEARI